ncbi:hypothetical protein VVD49_09610, partial [Uliginosibacterium sp. H3]|nr:hypothetical protein [Uliginosibacterium sp. H3]
AICKTIFANHSTSTTPPHSPQTRVQLGFAARRLRLTQYLDHAISAHRPEAAKRQNYGQVSAAGQGFVTFSS